jgi:hypothetical protein
LLGRNRAWQSAIEGQRIHCNLQEHAIDTRGERRDCRR